MISFGKRSSLGDPKKLGGTVGELRDAPLLDELRQQTTLEGVAAIIKRHFEGGEPLRIIAKASRFDEKTGEISVLTWDSYTAEEKRGAVSLWPSWNSPWIGRSPALSVLRKEVNDHPIVIDNVYIEFVPEHFDGGGAIPDFYRCQLVEIRR